MRLICAVFISIAMLCIPTLGQDQTNNLNSLIKDLRSNNSQTRVDAALNLWTLHNPEINYIPAVEPLIQALKNDNNWTVRSYSALALAQIKDTRAVEPLIQALNDKDWMVRSSAVSSLGELKDPRAVKPLIPLLKDDNRDVQEAASRALGELGWQPDSSQGNMPPHVGYTGATSGSQEEANQGSSGQEGCHIDPVTGSMVCPGQQNQIRPPSGY